VIPALLTSKYQVPLARPHAVERRRLTGRLDVTALPPLTVVAAPAGFGKTTLLTEWLATLAGHETLVGWLSLDEHDNSPTLFWRYVASAVHASGADAGAAALQLLTSSAGSTDAAVAVLLNELNGLTRNLILVLDDYHVVGAPEVHEAMSFLLDHQPPRLRLVLATRADPPLPLARMRARGQLLEVRAAELRFTVEEAAAYLNGSMGLGLAEEDIAVLDGRTEGWIAALQLAALSMRGRADASAFIAGFAGDDRYVVDYLAEEVLARQPAEVREFLLRTAVLQRLSGPLCDAVTGQDGGTASLVALERANLFLVPLDDRRRWYRYHHLFAEVLRAHLIEQYPDEVAELHRRAGAWFEANDDTPSAISHAVAGGDYSRAADLMELAIPVLRRERREQEIAGWVTSLPDEVARVRPVLALAFVGTLAQVSDFATVGQRLSDIERSLRADDGSWPAQPPAGMIVVDRNAYLALPAGVELYRAALALAHGRLDDTVQHAREALSLTPPGDDLVRAAAGALAGLASWATGDLAGAHAAYTESVAGLANVGFVADVLGCSITLGDIRQTQGRLDDALRTYRRALDLAAPQPGAPPLRGTADMHVGIAAVLLERDDLAAAAEHLAVSRRLGEHNGLPQNAYRSRVAGARLREAGGDLDGALQLLDEADRVYNGDFSPNVRPVPAMRARLRIRRGELDHVAAWAADRRLSTGDELSYLREYEHITYARLLLARGDLDEAASHQAAGLLQRLLRAAEEGGRDGSVIELLVLQSLAHHARRDVPAAQAALQRAVTLAEPQGYVRVFADEGPPMVALLKALGRPSTRYLRRLLAATTRYEVPASAIRKLVEPLTDRELDVVRLLSSDLDGPDIARALSVSLNTMRTHTKNIYAKLGVTSRRAAVRQAQELDLLRGRRRD
jgi:LuxR family transcriptional regulator, maltose regulon positive regulatory protein